ncbi:hypothetical protein K470DRAFT_297900 [Piedraia hortae CBS 480.64]|uniref:WW domain-containing protein n=1 Tax=Piedraia hortae CBS 480.64 TaxID=1314780 RepID=A0A6A7C7N4_9PEZI|nr:hypothetical protein K470DRAFT_297900 [Piedraia hortae CBS 480.64]
MNPVPEETPSPLRINKNSAQQPPYPGQDGVPMPSARRPSMNSDSSGAGKRRPHFDASDPQRPTISGYGTSPPTGRTIGRLAERRGTPVKNATIIESPGGPEPPPKDEDDISEPDEESATLFSIPVEPALRIPNPAGVNRLSSTASASTTRASRGSPPPPETPIGPSPSVRAETTAAAARRAQYANAPARHWTAAEGAGSNPHGLPVVFQGNEEASESLNNGMRHLHLHEEPPPAYSPPVAGSSHSQYPNEKGIRARAGSPTHSTTSAASKGSEDPNIAQHPAFAQPRRQRNGMAPINVAQANQAASTGPPTAVPISPPPLPEGWIAHIDSNSGQYYYIHLPTQSTQWEFPKGPTPLNLQETRTQNTLNSPAVSTFKQPLQSPSFGPNAPSTPFGTFDQASVASPTAAGFGGPPPVAGVEMYKIMPTNGVYFGPYLRYTNMDIQRGIWLGSIMLITDAAHAPTIHIHQSVDLSPNPRQLKARAIHAHRRWTFYRYDADLRMDDAPAKWTYAITSHLGCTRFEFLVAGRYETNWRFVAHSGNDFGINTSNNERLKLGGVDLMWKDVLLKHNECGGFHAQIGLGGQISADRMWKDVYSLRQWTQIHGRENRRNTPWTSKMEDDVTHAYFHYYTSHFDQPAIRAVFAQIPHICALDDGEIFDAYGSYPDYMQSSQIFKNLGRIGIEMFHLFQHHTTNDLLRASRDDMDLFTITGTGWHFIKYLGPSVVVVGPDTRSERSNTQVLSGPTYQGLFPKVALLPQSVQHCLWALPVPIIYPRVEAFEQVAQVATTGKKMFTGGFNMLGKVAGGVAGVVGAKGVVNSSFEGVKKAVGKSGLMQNVLNPFGEVEVLDELRDLWTHESKDLERTYLIRTLQGISHNKSLRMTFLSGSVNACGAGILFDPSRPADHKTMYQFITSPIVNAPAPSYIVKLLNNGGSKPVYIPLNGTRSPPAGGRDGIAPTDTKEEMLEIFAQDVDGRTRDARRLMPRRNYLALVVFDPELVVGNGAGWEDGSVAGRRGEGRLSLAADFMVQGSMDAQGTVPGWTPGRPVKYGPVVVPFLDFGR